MNKKFDNGTNQGEGFCPRTMPFLSRSNLLVINGLHEPIDQETFNLK